MCSSAEGAPAHDAGAPPKSNLEYVRELSIHVPLQTHAKCKSHEKRAIRVRVASTGNIRSPDFPVNEQTIISARQRQAA